MHCMESYWHLKYKSDKWCDLNKNTNKFNGYCSQIYNKCSYIFVLFTTGAVHHDELLYLLYVSRNFPKFNDTDPEVQMMYTLTKTFSEFAQTGYVSIFF